MNRKTAIALWITLALQMLFLVSGNSITNLILRDETGKNVCVDDLDCFCYANTTVTLDFNLVIDKPTRDLLFMVTMDDLETLYQLTGGYTVRTCYCANTKTLTVGTKCKANKVPVGTYKVNYSVYVPQYGEDADAALLTIESNKNFSAFRRFAQW